VVAGELNEEKHKLAGMPVSELQKLTGYCDILLIEADGSRRLPFKICAEHEPVICDVTQVVIGCVGLSAVGQPWKEGCFRWELAAESWRQGLIEPYQVAQILENRENGTRKRVGSREYRIVLNQADDEDKLRKAEEIGSMPRQAVLISAALQEYERRPFGIS